jgi:hypothetical protein
MSNLSLRVRVQRLLARRSYERALRQDRRVRINEVCAWIDQQTARPLDDWDRPRANPFPEQQRADRLEG